jgi:hypothetical protein
VSELILGPVLRHVTDTTATVWVETDGPCRVTVCGHTARTFTVSGHHYALVVVRGLAPGSTTPYEVHLDDERRWPIDDTGLPPSSIRTLGRPGPFRVLFGSCRAAAPHEPPYTLERDRDDRARGVDALWAHAMRMLDQPPEQWPDLAVFLGDQVYADDPSPRAGRKMEARAEADDGDETPPDVAADYEEYTLLYHEAWRSRVERWFLSVVPSAMIFDDHDVIDDWNISDSWVRAIREEPWWREHIVGAMMSYWVYQHLGNLSPDEIAADGMLDDLLELEDGTAYLREWALESERFTPVPGGYRFSYARDLGGVRLVMIDTRNGRVLGPDGRRMVDDEEWAWIVEQATVPCTHLVIGSSLPVFAPLGVHGLQQWNEAVCAGAWTRAFVGVGERIRRSLDLEAWAAFGASFAQFREMVLRVCRSEQAPATLTVLSGDIHTAYTAEISIPTDGDDDATGHTRVWQLVSSPLRNALVTREQKAMRFARSRVGTAIGRVLRRSGRRTGIGVDWDVVDGPFFNNNVGMLTFERRDARVVIEQAAFDEDREQPVLASVIDRHL